MPKRLPERWQPECIHEFRASAKARFDDALALAAAGRRSGAIYMWGYCTEMLLKAAYFSVIGKSETDEIKLTDILGATNKGRGTFGINWPKQEGWHNLRAWSELLVAERSMSSVPYAQQLATEVRRQGRRIGDLWSVSLRYHKNVAYTHEVKRVWEAAEWFFVNSDIL
jgi:hypothetical protein